MLDLTEKPFNLSEAEVEWVENTIDTMDLATKIGQILCPLGVSHDEDQLRNLVADYRPGGLLFRPSGMNQMARSHRLLQTYSDIPMLLAANLESGGNEAFEEGTYFGTPLQIASTDEDRFAYDLGYVSGREAQSIGVNWTYSPVADIDMNFRNPITNTRTYGQDPERVIRMCGKFMEGIRDFNVAVTLKHFPGDGVDERDHHLHPTINSLLLDEWDQSFGRVYKNLIEEGAQTIMVGHILFPSWQKKMNPWIENRQLLPASLDPVILGGLLRDRLGFNGLVVSDASTMTGFTQAMKREEAVPACIEAGCDMLLFNIGLESDFQYLLKGVETGRLTCKRIDEAVTRILGLKVSLRLLDKKRNNALVPEIDPMYGNPFKREHEILAKKCADRSITLVKDLQNLIPISSQYHRRILMYVLGDANKTSSEFKALLEGEGFKVEIFDNEKGEGNPVDRSPEEQVADFDLIMYYANLGQASNQTIIRPNWIVRTGTITPKYIQEIPTLFISVANPYHLQDVPRMKTFINAYTPSLHVLEAVVEKLVGRSDFSGVSPVDPFCGFWDTRI